MEIGKFKLAKSDLVRPPRKPIQEQIIPQEKPYTKEVFQTEVEPFIKGFIGGFPKNEMTAKLQSILDKAVERGALSVDEGTTYMLDRKQQLLDFVKQNPGQTLPELTRENFAIGGGAFKGTDLGTREGFAKIIPISELPKDQQKFINNWFKNNPDKTWEGLTNLQRNDLKKGQNVGVGYGGSTPKGVDNPAFQPLDKKGKEIAKHVYGTTDVTKDQRLRINRGEITMNTKPVKFNKDTDISLKMKRGSEIVEDVIFPNAQMKKDFIKAIRARVLQPEKAVIEFRNKDLAELFPISEKQAGRAAKYFIKELGLEYAKVPTRTASEVIKKTRDILEQTSSNLQEDRIRVAKTPVLDELGLKKKMDTAHRVSKTHMAKLGLEFNTDIMGIDSRLINQIIVKPSEIQLDRLYRKQFEIFEKLKKNPNSVELKDNLKNINKQVTDIVKNTSGRLVGVVIDPDTLDTSFQGIKKKYSFSNVLGESMTMKELANIPKEEQVKFLTKQLPKAVQLEVNRGFVPNDFKNILSNPDSQKAILKYAKQKAPELIAPLKKAFLDPTSKVSLRLFSQFPAIATTGLVGLGVYKGMGFDEEVRADDMSTPVDPGLPVKLQEQFDPEKADPTLKTAAGAYGAYKYGPQILKLLGNVGKGGVRLVASPFIAGTAAVSELMGEDPSQALAGSQLLYPEIIRQATDKGIKTVSGVKRFADKFKLGYDRLLALSPNLKYAPMVSKGMSGFGTIMIGADVIQGLGKRIGPDQRGPLTEQELLEMRGKETYMGNIADTFDKAYREGTPLPGRTGFADGPEDPSKRKFMKIMGGLASLPIVGRFFDIAPVAYNAAEDAAKIIKGAPPHFLGLVNKIRALGKIVDPKKMGVSEDRFSNVYEYGDYKMFEGKDGQIEIAKDKLMATDYGDAKVSEEYMSYNPKSPKIGKKGELTGETEPQYDEYTAYADQDGKMKDVVDGVEPSTIDEGTYSKEELEQLIIEQVEKDLKKGKK
jgi:hypothetical protein